MHPFIHFGSLSLPGYGLSITFGAVLANVIAALMIRKRGEDWLDLILLEAYGLGGAFLGAKLLFLLVNIQKIDWSRIFEKEYFSGVMRGGFVFYGGLILAIIAVFAAAHFHKIDAMRLLREYTFLIPFAHGFGRIGCFMAGCCYGVPYDGRFAVTFPEDSFAPSGISLFPSQPAESICLFIISAIILILQLTVSFRYSLELYVFLYGICRFFLERFRGDTDRGLYFGLSTSQWIAVLMVAASIVFYLFDRRKKCSEEKE